MFKFMSKMTIMFTMVTVLLTGCNELDDHLTEIPGNSETVLQEDSNIVELNEVQLEQEDSTQQEEEKIEEPVEVEEGVVPSVDEGKVHFINTGNSRNRKRKK